MKIIIPAIEPPGGQHSLVSGSFLIDVVVASLQGSVQASWPTATRRHSSLGPVVRVYELVSSVTLISLLFVCLLFSQEAQAVVPAPDGGYPGGNTAEGQNALLSLNVNAGTNNTAVGWFALKSNVEGQLNTAVGAAALFNNTGDANTAIGGAALFSNSSASHNTAVGLLALFHNTNGSYNTAIGDSALFTNINGEFNTATGYQALFNNTGGIQNTATGVQALFSNTNGVQNTAVGDDALRNNTEGTANTATGYGALLSNTEGNANTANGITALTSNTSGQTNTAIGTGALRANTTASQNTATGGFALENNTNGSQNTAAGYRALQNNISGEGNTAIGYQALFNNTTGNVNVALGRDAGSNVTGTGNICIVSPGEAAVNNRTYISRIRGVEVGNGDGINVMIDSDGQLGTSNSSRRFKKEITPMEGTSEVLFALKPVTFKYKNEDNNGATPQFGLIAEDVAEVNPHLVVRDPDGEPLSVRYDAVNAMLLNEFLKEHRKNEDQAATIARMEQQIEGLTAGLQKVSGELKAARTAPQTVSVHRSFANAFRVGGNDQ